MYSWLYASFALSSLMGAFVVNAFLDKIGYQMFFNLMTLFTAISFALLQMFKSHRFRANIDYKKVWQFK